MHGDPQGMAGDGERRTQIVVAIPVLAGKGDVLVKNAGSSHASLSNAFPFNGQGSGPTGPAITNVFPATVSALAPSVDRKPRRVVIVR